MTFAILLSMLSLSFVMSISPGPVNMMIVSSGINYGFKKTFAFISGATIGFTLLLVIIAFGFQKFLLSSPNFLFYIEIVGSLFIIYMGYKIATSISSLDGQSSNKTLRFYEGFLLQWLNPKAWLACIAGVSLFASNKTNLIIFIILYFIVCYLCLSFWGVLGDKTTKFLNTELRLRVFNMTMGFILIFSALSLIIINFLQF
ncbi:MAG: lysine transporter LysE [Arcobacter sp.]|nr:MAG: lysine transporter LysE [Arcobacter sp.]